MKRSVDFCVAAILLILVSPIIGFLAILIRFSSKGPAIFVQDRVGRNGDSFRCYKLRTMADGTANVPTHQAIVAHVTPIGSVLRRSKLDELPQLWNVLRGEMSLVGPRPCLPTQTRLIEERKRRGVLAIRPGITGLAQVRGIDMTDPVQLAEIDLEYMRSKSLGRDLILMFQTVIRSCK